MNNFRSVRPEPQIIRTFDIPSVSTSNLKTGHPVYIQKTEDIGVVRIEFFWGKSKFHQKKSFVATLAADMLFSGNPKRNEEEIIKKLDYLGASYQTDTTLFGTSLILRCQKKFTKEVIDWVIENTVTVDYPEELVQNQCMIRKASLDRQQQTPKYWSNRISLEKLYGEEHPLSKFGEMSDYDLITSYDLKEFHTQYMGYQDRMVLLSGDVDDSIVSVIEDQFSKFGYGSFEIIENQNVTPLAISDTLVKKKIANTSQASLQLISHVAPVSMRERHVLTVLNLILGGYFGSRLMQELREKQGLTYGIGSYFKSAFNEFTWIISGELNASNGEKSIESIHQIFEDLKETLVAEEELQKVKQYYSGIYRSGFDGPFAMSSKVQQILIKRLPQDYYTTVLPTIWSVTAEEIQEVANKYLNVSLFHHVIAGEV